MEETQNFLTIIKGFLSSCSHAMTILNYKAKCCIAAEMNTHLRATSKDQVTSLADKHAAVFHQLLTVQESKPSEQMTDFSFTPL